MYFVKTANEKKEMVHNGFFYVQAAIMKDCILFVEENYNYINNR